MDKSIISKFDLEETNLNFGNSFITGIKVYCDETGNPSENIFILNTKNKAKSIVTKEMLLDIDKLHIEKLMISY